MDSSASHDTYNFVQNLILSGFQNVVGGADSRTDIAHETERQASSDSVEHMDSSEKSELLNEESVASQIQKKEDSNLMAPITKIDSEKDTALNQIVEPNKENEKMESSSKMLTEIKHLETHPDPPNALDTKHNTQFQNMRSEDEPMDLSLPHMAEPDDLRNSTLKNYYLENINETLPTDRGIETSKTRSSETDTSMQALDQHVQPVREKEAEQTNTSMDPETTLKPTEPIASLGFGEDNVLATRIATALNTESSLTQNTQGIPYHSLDGKDAFESTKESEIPELPQKENINNTTGNIASEQSGVSQESDDEDADLSSLQESAENNIINSRESTLSPNSSHILENNRKTSLDESAITKPKSGISTQSETELNNKKDIASVSTSEGIELKADRAKTMTTPTEKTHTNEKGSDKSALDKQSTPNIVRYSDKDGNESAPNTDIRVIVTKTSSVSSSEKNTTDTKAEQKVPNKPSVPQPEVIDVDAKEPRGMVVQRETTPLKQQPQASTPVKQVQAMQPVQKASPRAAGGQTPAKQQTPLKSSKQAGSFIDNLIATGVPIVIPDDDDVEEVSTDSMPKARSNIFKVKSQQYKGQKGVKSPSTFGRNRPVLKDNVQYYDPQAGQIPRSPVMTYPQQPIQVMAYPQQPIQSPSRQIHQTTDIPAMTREEYMPSPHIPTASPQRGAASDASMSPSKESLTLQRDQFFTPPKVKDPSKRVTFSPVADVYPIPTVPRHTSPQRFTTPPRGNHMSPRMASPNAGHFQNVRRNIAASPRQKQPGMSPFGRGREPTIVIDDDQPSAPRRAPQVTPQKRPMQQQSPVSVSVAPNPLLQQIYSQQQPHAPVQSATRPVQQQMYSTQQSPAPQQSYTRRPEDPGSRETLPIITNVTSMAREPNPFKPHPMQPQGIVTTGASPSQTQMSAAYIRQANEKTPVKRSRSDDTIVMTSPAGEPLNKRRNTTETHFQPDASSALMGVSMAPPVEPQSHMKLPVSPVVASTGASGSTDSSVTVVVTGQTQPSPEVVSPSKQPPEVFIDVDVDDKSTVRRVLNIEQGHITKTLVSPPGNEASPSDTESVTSPDSTNSAMSSSSKAGGKSRSAAGKGFSCGDCGKTFNTRAALKTHFKSHSKEKPFECDVCGKHFSQKASLKKHIYTHFKDKDKK